MMFMVLLPMSQSMFTPLNCLEHGHDGGESLRVHVCADDIDVVFDAAPDEIHMVVLEQVSPEALTLGFHPGQGQTGSDGHAGFGHPVLPQLLPDAGERQGGNDPGC